MKNDQTIPVFMLHSVNIHDRAWLYPYLSVPLSMLDALLKFIHRNRFQTLFLDQWWERSGLQRDPKEIVLTFDDGYLDNWVYLFPLLEKYECHATIFVNPEFVQPGEQLRQNLVDVWKDDTDYDGLADLGYLNWREIEVMNASPWVDIQSHSMTHTWYPTGETVVDFNLPVYRNQSGQPTYPWMAWNEFQDKKPFSLNLDLMNKIPLGQPIFEHGRSLGARRFFPTETLLEQMQDFTAGKPASFFYDPRCRETLYRRWNEIVGGSKDVGTYESDAACLSRYRYELFESRNILEKKLGEGKVYLCWPGGAYNDLSVKVSIEAGYVASTLASKQRDKAKIQNGSYKRIPRKSMGARIMYKGEQLGISLYKKRMIQRIDPNALRFLSVKIEKAFFLLFHSIIRKNSLL